MAADPDHPAPDPGAGPIGVAPTVRAKVFLSYCHKDARHLRRLLDHLKPLQDAGLTDVWADTRLKPGQLWRDEIQGALDAARVAVLLVSVDFINSGFIRAVELPALLRAAEAEGVLILPVIVGPCRERFLRTRSLSQFQAVNDPSEPIATMRTDRRDAIWDRLAARVEDYLSGAG